MEDRKELTSGELEDVCGGVDNDVRKTGWSPNIGVTLGVLPSLYATPGGVEVGGLEKTPVLRDSASACITG